MFSCTVYLRVPGPPFVPAHTPLSYPGSAHCLWEVQLENPLNGGAVLWDRSSAPSGAGAVLGAGSGAGSAAGSGAGAVAGGNPASGPWSSGGMGSPVHTSGALSNATNNALLSVPIRLRNVVSGMYLMWKAVSSP